MTGIVDLHLVRAARASGADMKRAIADATVNDESCRGIGCGDEVRLPDGSIGHVLWISPATSNCPTTAHVAVAGITHAVAIGDLNPTGGRSSSAKKGVS